MRILFLDDDHKRVKRFQSNMIGTHIVHVMKPKDAIGYLATAHDPEWVGLAIEPNPFDAIFLDYDLDEEHLGINGYGTDVTRWITEESDYRFNKFLTTLFVIHSLNSEGGLEMYKQLSSKGLSTVFRPFAWENMTPAVLTELIDKNIVKEP